MEMKIHHYRDRSFVVVQTVPNNVSITLCENGKKATRYIYIQEAQRFSSSSFAMFVAKPFMVFHQEPMSEFTEDGVYMNSRYGGHLEGDLSFEDALIKACDDLIKACRPESRTREDKQQAIRDFMMG